MVKKFDKNWDSTKTKKSIESFYHFLPEKRDEGKGEKVDWILIQFFSISGEKCHQIRIEFIFNYVSFPFFEVFGKF